MSDAQLPPEFNNWGELLDSHHSFVRQATKLEAEIIRLREELEKAQSWGKLWYETSMEYYPPNWATDGTPKNIIGNIVRYTESREADRLAAWKAEAEAWRAHTRELHRRDCGAPDRFDTYTPLVAARAATDAIEKNAS